MSKRRKRKRQRGNYNTIYSKKTQPADVQESAKEILGGTFITEGNMVKKNG